MKKLGVIFTALALLNVLTGCRGGNSTYTTAPTTAMTTAETTVISIETTSDNPTPTVNNGNGPVTTASPEDTTTAKDINDITKAIN